MDNKSLHDFSAQMMSGENISLSRYKGKVLLIVNVASKCGFTPQYKGLEGLWRKYKDEGFVVLGFPCNQFGNQEPGNSEDIKSFCQLNFGVSFPLFAKVDVNGDKAPEFYNYLKSEQRGFLGTKDIKWNFTKFLVDKKGKPVKRYAPQKKPEDIASDIEKLLRS